MTKIYKLPLLLIFIISACSQDTGTAQSTEQDQEPSENGSYSEIGDVNIEDLADNLNHPWGMAFLPDGRLLVTERAGDLRILSIDNTLSDPVEGVPEVFANGQGGLLDVALDPDFQNNKFVYLSFAEPGENNTASTALGRGKFNNDRIEDFKVIFTQVPKIGGGNHFGGRVVFEQDGEHLYLTMGERFQFDPAQELSNHLGTIVRIKKDGSIPSGNPFVNQQNAKDEIWSYGNRNIESGAIDPGTGNFWIAEMGPKGGDELNRISAGKNYGWPVVSWGNNYDDSKIPDPTTRPEFADATIHWTPVISPSGMIFYTGSLFPQLKGKMLIGGLTAKGIVIVDVNGDTAKEIDRISLGARIRDVDQAPDGSIYVLTDQNNGNVWKLTPKN